MSEWISGSKHGIRKSRGWDAFADELRAKLDALESSGTPVVDQVDVERWLFDHADDLLVECERLRAALDKLKRQQWSNQNRAEVAERGHKACLARESEYLAECERLRAALKEPCAECGHIDWREFGVADDE